MSIPQILFVAATFSVGGVVKGVTGMGLPTVAMGALGAVLSPLTKTGLVWRGALRLDNLALSALAIAPALAGMGAGQILRRRVSPATFRRWFLLGLLCLGAQMALKPLVTS